MYTSRLTNCPPNDPLNNTLPSLSPRLYSFAEPNTSLQNPQFSSQSPSSISMFVRDFHLLHCSPEGQKTTIGHIAMINGNDKKQVKQALDQQNIDKNIKNRMNKYLNVLQKVIIWGENKKNHESPQKNIKNSIIMQISASQPDPTKYITEPSAENHTHQQISSSPFKIQSSRYKQDVMHHKICDKSPKNHEKYNSEPKNKSASSSKASHSKVFKKIQIKSVNYVPTNKQNNKNQASPHKTNGNKNSMGKSSVTPSKLSSQKYKNTVHRHARKPSGNQKQKYKISRRQDQTKKPTIKALQTPKNTSINNKKNINQSRLNLQKNDEKQKQKSSRLSSTSIRQVSARKSLSVKSNSGSKSNLTRSRLKQQVIKLQKNEKKEKQNEQKCLQINKSNHNLLRQTMQKTCMFLDMLRMMDN